MGCEDVDQWPCEGRQGQILSSPRCRGLGRAKTLPTLPVARSLPQSSSQCPDSGEVSAAGLHLPPPTVHSGVQRWQATGQVHSREDGVSGH